MPSPPSRAGDRSVTDGTTPMGIATTHELERVSAAMGVLDAAPLRFESADDLPNGGTLCALPALRDKIARLAQSSENVARWAASLATSWMERHEAHIIGTLLVNPAHDKVIEHLCAELNQSETL